MQKKLDANVLTHREKFDLMFKKFKKRTDSPTLLLEFMPELPEKLEGEHDPDIEKGLIWASSMEDDINE